MYGILKHHLFAINSQKKEKNDDRFIEALIVMNNSVGMHIYSSTYVNLRQKKIYCVF